MKKVLINYSDENFENQRKWNSRFARVFGGFDEIIEYGPDNLDFNFKEKNIEILSQKRGGGNWLWKPYIILDALNKLEDGDYLFYEDSGSVIIRNINYLIRTLDKFQQDIMTFELPLVEKQWTKRDTFIIMECDSERFTDTNQRLGGYILLKKSDDSVKFITEFLMYAQMKEALMTGDNTLGMENYPEFIAHREDQSILSLLSKKWGVKAFRDPSHRANFLEPYDNYIKRAMPTSSYPTLIIANRTRNIFYYILWFFIYYRISYKIRKFVKRSFSIE